MHFEYGEELDERYEPILKGKNKITIECKQDGVRVGLLEAWMNLDEGKRFVAVEGVYVDPGHRGNGTASSMIRLLKDKCHNDFEWIELAPVEGTDLDDNLYTRNGFVLTNGEFVCLLSKD